MFLRKKKIILIIYSIIIICAIIKVRSIMAEEGKADACTADVVQSVKCIGYIDAYAIGGAGVFNESASTGDTEYGGVPAAYVNECLYEQNTDGLIEGSLKSYKPEKTVKKVGGLAVRKRDKLKLSDKERRIMYRIVEAEAGGENIAGRMLVANVLINRYLSSRFPDSMEKVVFAHSGRTYQFSPVSDGRYYSVKVSRNTKKAVNKALSGIDNSKGAVYFMSRKYAGKSSAEWFDNCLNYLFEYGCHEFFK